MTTEQNLAFDELCRQWLRHDDLRSSGADLKDLWVSRAELDAVRRRARAAARVAA